jgi:serine/threonine protein kinase
MALVEGQMIGQYRIDRQLGSGGMATVYRAYHARLNRMVAIKVMHQAFVQDRGFIARFEREAQIVASLEHPNIVPIYDFAEHEGQPYLVMKYIEGRTLKTLMEREDGVSLDLILRILPPLADALDYAHRRGVLHRDIKPSNIILDKDGTPYLTDFGLARLAQLGESTLSSDVLLGTPHYISPEQAQGQRDLDHRTDLYSFGIVIYELLVGRVPFSADTPFAVIHDHIYRPVPLPSSINPDIPPAVEKVLLKALAKAPGDRYESATALVQALRQAIAESGLTDLRPDRRALASSSEARARERSAPLPGDADDEQATLRIDPSEPGKEAASPAAGTPQPASDPFAEPAHSDREVEKPKHTRVETSIDLGNLGEHLRELGPRIEAWAERIGEAFDEGDSRVQISFSGRDDELAPPDDSAALRRRAERQVKKRNEFFGHLAAYIVVNILLWTIFGFTRGGELFGPDFAFNAAPWPLIVMLGWGAGVLSHGIETFFETGKRAARRIVRVHQEFERVYGPRWWQTASKQELRRVRKRVEEPMKKWQEFFEHLGVYVMINTMLWVIYSFTLGSTEVNFPWPLVVMAAWGVGMVVNLFDVLGVRANQRAIDRQIEAEMAERYGRTEKAKRKNDEFLPADETAGLSDSEDESAYGVRLTADGELTDSVAQQFERRGRGARRRR